MKFTYQYVDEKSRSLLLEQHKDKFLIEEQNITEGNYLIFSDEPIEKEIVYTHVPSGEIELLKVQSESLQETVDSILLDILPTILG